MIVYHPGTGTIIDMNEVILIDTDEEVNDDNVEELAEQRGFSPTAERFAIITGNPMEGMSVHGPFYDLEAGLNWAERCGREWYITPMEVS